MQLAFWVAEKKCKACGEVKPLEDFSPEPRVRDGRAARCRRCHYAKWGNKPRSPERLAYHREHQEAWRKANLDEARERGRAEYQRNRAKYIARARRWRADNPERRREQAAADARRRRLDRDADAVAYADILRRDPCSYCGEPAVEVDHIVAVTTSGDNGWPNLTAACRLCNGRKSDAPLLRFLLRLNARA